MAATNEDEEVELFLAVPAELETSVWECLTLEPAVDVESLLCSFTIIMRRL